MCCLLIRTRRAATPGRVVVAGLHSAQQRALVAPYTQRVNWALNSHRLFLITHPVNSNQTTCIRPSSAINPRGDLRQRGGRLLVTRDTRSSILTAADSRLQPRSVRNYSGSRAAIFYFPLSPAFSLALPLPSPSPSRALLYLRPLPLLFPTLRSSAHPTSMKGTTAQTGPSA